MSLLLLFAASADIKDDIQARWDEMDQASSRSDAEGYFRYRTQDFSMSSAEQPEMKMTRDQSLNSYRKMFASQKGGVGTRLSQTRVVEITEQSPDQAKIRTSNVSTYVVAKTPTMVGSTDITTTTCDETWAKTDEGWMLQSVSLVSQDYARQKPRDISTAAAPTAPCEPAYHVFGNGDHAFSCRLEFTVNGQPAFDKTFANVWKRDHEQAVVFDLAGFSKTIKSGDKVAFTVTPTTRIYFEDIIFARQGMDMSPLSGGYPELVRLRFHLKK